MPQFPDLGQQVRAWTEAAATRSVELRDAIVDGVERTRQRVEEFPERAIDELRQRLNVLDLATRDDLEYELGSERAREAAMLNEFLMAQRQRDEQFVATLRAEMRSELHDELERLVLPPDDDTFAALEESLPLVASRPAPLRTREFDDDDDEDLDD